MNKGLFGLPKLTKKAGLVLLGKRELKRTTSVTFIKELSNDIDEYHLVCNNIVQSATVATGLIAGRFSTDRGASWDSGTNYGTTAWTWGNGFNSTGGAALDTQFYVALEDPDAGYGSSSRHHIFFNSRGLYPHVLTHLFGRAGRAANDPQSYMLGAVYRNTKRPTGIQIIGTGGVIMVSGSIQLYGYIKS